MKDLDFEIIRKKIKEIRLDKKLTQEYVAKNDGRIPKRILPDYDFIINIQLKLLTFQ